jgi:hypothetical protein
MIAPRTLVALICLTALSGCSACLPGQSRLDQGMVANTAAATASGQSVPGSEDATQR